MNDNQNRNYQPQSNQNAPLRVHLRDTPPRKSYTGIIVFAAIAFILIAGGGVAYVVLNKPQAVDVGIEFIKPDRIFAGQPFTLTVSFANYSDSILEGAKIALTLPDTLSFVGQPPERRIVEQSAGDFGPGSINQQAFNLIALGNGQTLMHVSAKLSYRIPARSSAESQSTAEFDIPIGQPALAIDISAPEKVVSGENFDVEVRYQNNSDQDLKNVTVHLDYPPSFHFMGSSVKPDQSTTDWVIAGMNGGAQGSFTVKGNVVGPEHSFFSVSGSAKVRFGGQAYELASQTVKSSVATAPLSVRIQLQGSDNYIAHLNDDVRYTFTYKNNSDVALENAVLQASFLGELFDFSTLKASGAFDSRTNTVTWNAVSVPEFASIPPGNEGSVDVAIRLKNQFPITRLSDKNYVLKAQAQVESPTIPPETTIAKTVSVASIESKVAGELRVSTTAFFRDAASGILNKGPYPPKVNAPTRYTIHWKLVNTATDVSDIRVSAFLQSGATFTNATKSTTDTAPAYNSGTGEVSWAIKRLAATKGMLGSPVEAIFQIEHTPAVNQVGEAVPLLGETKVQATDTFVNQPITLTFKGVDTNMQDDATLANTSDRHVQP